MDDNLIVDTVDADLDYRGKEAQIQKLIADTEFTQLRSENLRVEVDEQLATLKNLGTFHFYTEIDTSSVIRTILAMNRISRQNPNQVFTLIFNSGGGGVTDGFALFDFIAELRQRGHKVITKVQGIAASMAAVVCQAGSERVMTPNAYLMFHQISTSGLPGPLRQNRDRIDWAERLQSRSEKVVYERMRKDADFDEISKRWNHNEWFVDADEALDLGLIDRISYT